MVAVPNTINTNSSHFLTLKAEAAFVTWHGRKFRYRKVGNYNFGIRFSFLFVDRVKSMLQEISYEEIVLEFPVVDGCS